jgi:hypothetical protein
MGNRNKWTFCSKLTIVQYVLIAEDSKVSPVERFEEISCSIQLPEVSRRTRNNHPSLTHLTDMIELAPSQRHLDTEAEAFELKSFALQLMLLPSIDWRVKSWLIKTDLAVTRLACAASNPWPSLLINVIQETFALVPWRETDQVILAKALEPLRRQPQQSPEVPGWHPADLNPYCSAMIQLPDPHTL